MSTLSIKVAGLAMFCEDSAKTVPATGNTIGQPNGLLAHCTGSNL